jgi:hypothetical protein
VRCQIGRGGEVAPVSGFGGGQGQAAVRRVLPCPGAPTSGALVAVSIHRQVASSASSSGSMPLMWSGSKPSSVAPGGRFANRSHPARRRTLAYWTSAARPIFHHTKDSIEAHLTIVFAAWPSPVTCSSAPG